MVFGAGFTYYKGWFSTDKSVLDLTSAADFETYLGTSKISKALAEHVLEHLPESSIKQFAENLARYLHPGGRVRIAVPDGNHADPGYIEAVRPGGTGLSADEHLHLFNRNTISAYFDPVYFTPIYLEYWDENKQFHTVYQNDEYGYIRRSFLNDPRNKDGEPHYTSLIVDFIRTKNPFNKRGDNYGTH